MIHNIKIREEFADAVLSGEKSFELRENDRGYQRGDLIRFDVITWDGLHNYGHKLNDATFVITYVLNGWGLEPGYVALAIKKVEVDNG